MITDIDKTIRDFLAPGPKTTRQIIVKTGLPAKAVHQWLFDHGQPTRKINPISWKAKDYKPENKTEIQP